MAVIITVLLSTAINTYAQLPVRAREVQLISNNSTNYTRLQAVNGQVTNWTLTYPATVGTTGSLLSSTVTGATAATSWLAPGSNGDLLSISAGIPAWSNPSTIMWLLAGNPTTTAWNGAAGSFIGTTTTQPLSIATTNATAQDINFYTGAAGANLRMTIGSAGAITLYGTAGTPNVTLTSAGGAANVAIPGGYDRVLVSNATGDVSQTTYSAIAAQSSWTLLGNAGTAPGTNFLGTTDAQALVLRTNNVERLRVNSTGELGIGTTAAAGYSLHVGGTAGTPNVRLDATGGVANVGIPIGYDRVLVSNATGDVSQTSYNSVVSTFAWLLAGNASASAWNGAAGSFLGTTTTQPLSIATTNATAQDINFYTGAAGANLRMTIGSAGAITLNGTAGTPNVTLTSVSGVANVAIPVGYDRVLVSNATGDVFQTTYNAIASQSSWTLLGNAGTAPGTNFLGTTDAQALVLRTNNVERLRVNSTGELGIGTTAAAGYSLHVGGTVGTPNVRLDATGGVANVAIPVGFDRVLLSNALGQVSQTSYSALAAATAWTLLGNAATNPLINFLGTTDAQPLIISTNSLERIRVMSSGEVGIGTTAPATAFEVNNGNIQIGTSVLGLAGSLRFEEDAINGNNFASFKAASSMVDDMTYTLPATIGTTAQVLRIASLPLPTATTATLEWAPVFVTPGVVTVDIIIDDQNVVVAASTTFLRLVGDALPAARTVLLANGVTNGQHLVIRCVAAGANGVQFLDAGNLALSGNFNLNNSDTITLIWDAATNEWLEVARRNN